MTGKDNKNTENEQKDQVTQEESKEKDEARSSPKDDDERLNSDFAGENNISQGDENLEKIKSDLEEKEKKCEEYFNRLQRVMAEFDNYKKRTTKEKQSIYSNAVSDTVLELLPVVDNLERAIDSCKEEQQEHVDSEKLLEGVEMILKQFKDCLQKLGVEEINSIGEVFDHDIHNAVMHVEDESVGENIIVEEFKKGYKLKDKVIRYSMVKVAN